MLGGRRRPAGHLRGAVAVLVRERSRPGGHRGGGLRLRARRRRRGRDPQALPRAGRGIGQHRPRRRRRERGPRAARHRPAALPGRHRGRSRARHGVQRGIPGPRAGLALTSPAVLQGLLRESWASTVWSSPTPSTPARSRRSACRAPGCGRGGCGGLICSSPRDRGSVPTSSDRWSRPSPMGGFPWGRPWRRTTSPACDEGYGRRRRARSVGPRRAMG